jgi:hypothetical protein
MVLSGQPISALMAALVAIKRTRGQRDALFADPHHKHIKHVNVYLILLNMILTFFGTGATVMDNR